LTGFEAPAGFCAI